MMKPDGTHKPPRQELDGACTTGIDAPDNSGSANSLKIAIYVQHLLGTGHLVRMMALADALSERNHSVLLVSGGELKHNRTRSYEFVQLPITKTAPGDFRQLLDQQGLPVDEFWKQSRTEQLLDAVLSFEPQVLIVETFPFGRRQMRFELMPLLSSIEKMSPLPLVVASIRDILQSRAPKRNRETVELLQSSFDAVLVHGDPSLAPLSASFPLSHQIEPLLHYSGYINQSRRVFGKQGAVGLGGDGFKEVIVSAGGGAVGMNLLLTAIKAKPLSILKDAVWRIMIGKNLEAQDANLLRSMANDQILVEENRSDFPLLLHRCELSISQSGYNSCLDIIHAKVRSVMVPFSADGETEQYQRAQILSEKGLVVLLPESALTPQNLAAAVNKAMKQWISQDLTIETNGAEKSAMIIERLAQRC
ncbi:MAG: glycosyl transferase family 28 [Gammaproteobacteria bacterium]|nr:glycosyl transferase family 28 [Gammaproteobacteria bacterium]